MQISKLVVSWSDEGCVAQADGFSGVTLRCPRCKEILQSGVEHRCGDEVLPKKSKSPRKAPRSPEGVR